MREQWADFGAEAVSSVALTATAHACHAREQGLTTNARAFHLRAIEALEKAQRSWSASQMWQERLINNRELCVTDLDVEQVRALIHETVEQHKRVGALLDVLHAERLDTRLMSSQRSHTVCLSSAQPEEGRSVR